MDGEYRFPANQPWPMRNFCGNTFRRGTGECPVLMCALLGMGVDRAKYRFAVPRARPWLAPEALRSGGHPAS